MSRLDNFIRSLASPVVKGGVDRPAEDTAGDARRRAEWRRRRRRYNSGDAVVEKQSVDRRAQAFASLEQSVVDRGGMRKPYDPLFLRDISANAVVQAYIDTLAQDVASAGWKLKPRDEDANVSDEQIAKWERELRKLHPELPFRDVLEETARILLELGDATWVKHYYEGSNDLAEFVVVDSSTMFKKVDDFGITEGYLQASRQSRDVANEFDTDDVVWFSWSLRPDRHYGQGPLEKAQNEVELLEELAEKERLDLIAGSNPGVISPDYQDEFGGTVPDEDWDNFVEQMQLDEGERHRVGYSKIPVDFEPITANYQELQILERSRYWVTVLGSVFKVNPSYAGFDFENVNRATDESQQEAYAQRGFRVTLRQLEESLNRGLIWEELSEDVRFEFEREQTVQEKESRASLIREQAEAGQEMAEALEDDDAGVHFRDGELVVDDGEITPSEDDDAGGGFFASVDDPVDADGVIRTKRQAKEIADAVLEEISTDRFVPPESVADECRRALELIDEHGRDTASGGTRVALARARQIIDHYEAGEPLIGTNEDGVPYVVEIANFFARHRAQGNHEFDDGEYDHRYEDPGWLADKLWGGDPGFDWSTALAERIDEVEAELTGGGSSGKGISDDVADTAVARLSDDEWAEYERHLIDAHKSQIQPESLEDIEKRAWRRDEAVPEYVREGVRNAIDRGAIFDRFETVPGTLRETVEDILRDSLTQPQGWSLDSIVDRMGDAFPGIDTDDLETVARTETTSVLNQAREVGYKEREDADRFAFYWQGPGDSRTTDLCEDLKIATGQESGTPDTDFTIDVPREPVDMDTLVTLEREASDHHFPDLQFRRHVPHINCRHTFVRDAAADVDIDVDVPDADEIEVDLSKACGCGDPVDYEAVIDQFRRYVKSRSYREREVEQAVGQDIRQVLRRALEATDGSIKPACRRINRRLEQSADYDADESGRVSTDTLYGWIDKYDDELADVVG